jgi:cytoskeletal protein CcmA (bactofilin family)
MKGISMQLLNLKNKTEPRKTNEFNKVFDEKNLPLNKIPDIKNNFIIPSSLMIGDGVSITGSIKAKDEVTIQGTVEGDIECLTLNVSKNGNIKGKIKSDTLIVEGIVDGEININDLINIKSDGMVSGKIYYGSIQISEGGKLIGEIDYKDKNIKQETFKDWETL